MSPPPDPILERRALVARAARLGQSLGYLLLLAAVAAFVAGFLTGFPQAAVTVSVAGLIGACVVLPPAIVAGFSVRAAERDDRRAGR